MGEISMSIDRKSQNGAGVSRIQLESGNESTVVQNQKATTAHLKALTGEFPGSGKRSTDPASRANVELFAEHNVGDIRSSAKQVRGKSSSQGGKGKGKGKTIVGPSDRDAYITSEAKRFDKGGGKI